jgi:hypothetical protein
MIFCLSDIILSTLMTFKNTNFTLNFQLGFYHDRISMLIFSIHQQSIIQYLSLEKTKTLTFVNYNFKHTPTSVIYDVTFITLLHKMSFNVTKNEFDDAVIFVIIIFILIFYPIVNTAQRE